MGVQVEQERRREFLLRALEVCPDLEQALTAAVRVGQFIIHGQNSHKMPHAETQPAGLPSSEESRKTSNRSRRSEDDDAYLRRLWQSNLTIEAIAQELHRAPSSIYGRVRILTFSSGKRDTKNGKRKIKLPGSDRRSLAVISKAGDGIEADAPITDGPYKNHLNAKKSIVAISCPNRNALGLPFPLRPRRPSPLKCKKRRAKEKR